MMNVRTGRDLSVHSSFISGIIITFNFHHLHQLMRSRKRNRLRGFDYTSDRLYFVTSCVRNRECYFGDIVPIPPDQIESFSSLHYPPSHQMILNPCGQIAEKQWHWLTEQYPYVKSHSFVVMPNHVHGVLEINNGYFDHIPVRTGRDLSVQECDQNVKLKIKSLSELIGAYKTTVSKQIHLIIAPDGSRSHADFAWHRSFHDHIIRTAASYHRIVHYIQQNPSNWVRDKFYKNLQ